MKASEVFDLPLEADDSCLYQSCGSDKHVARFDTQEQAKIAEACINHADALADALARLLEAHFSKGGVTTDVAASALEILKAYVGEDK